VRERNTTHGKSRNPEYAVEYAAWNNMTQRCLSALHPSYSDWGGRGITVCPEWQGKTGFETFLRDMGKRPSPELSLHRINNDEGYNPINTKWGNSEEQNSNKRTNHLVTAFGETLTVSQWVRKTGLKFQTITSRLKRWSPEDALSRPLQTKVSHQESIA
jgi:hypothetical protein